MEQSSLTQSTPDPTIPTPPQNTPSSTGVPTPQTTTPVATANVAQEQNVPPPLPSQPTKSKLTPILIAMTALFAIAGLAYGAYWYQSQGGFSQTQSVVIEESIPKIESEVQEVVTLPNEDAVTLAQSDNPVRGEAQANYAVENQYGGYFVMISAYAMSTAGDVTEISVWAPEDEEQPWDAVEGDAGMTINLTTENKSDVFVQFRDSTGNTSEVITITQEMIEAVRKDI